MSLSRWFAHRIRTRYQETDQMGVVYHANYLNWFELGRTELIREAGQPYRELESQGLLLPVMELDMKFRQPARYDDEITIYTRIVEFTHVRLHFESQIRLGWFALEELEPLTGGSGSGSGSVLEAAEAGAPGEPSGELLVSGSTRHVWVNGAFRPVRLDKAAPATYRLLKETANLANNAGG